MQETQTELAEPFSLARDGSLCFAGYSLKDLAQKYGTPLYLLDEMQIRARCRDYRSGLVDYPEARVIYASKALMNQAICRLMEQEGLELDVISGGELYTALCAGFPPRKIWFHGNNKTPAELEMALDAGVGRFVIDSFEEIDVLEEAAAAKGRIAHVALRATPGIEAHTHHYIQTGRLDSKFGIPIMGELLLMAAHRVRQQRHLHLTGLHCHIGSQIHEMEPFLLAARTMVCQLTRLRDNEGLVLTELNLGGGFGIRHLKSDCPLQPAEVVKELVLTVREACQEHNFPLPKLYIEPGRSIVGEAGVTLYTLGVAKEIPGVRKYLTVDGGMADNPRPALYGAGYEALLVERPLALRTQKVHLAGRHCESGDILIRDLLLPEAHRGEHLVVLATGAYTYSMASNYNRVPRAAMLLLNPERAEVIVHRERYEDLVINDRIPKHLRRATREQRAGT